ncbi:glycosyltransferase family 4 protein [Nitrospirillum sp. BR 11163]|uniref:glycosyltransferase family 4 protein n=1 Tax=Nitrospirillum sp. BR 11163 TaxID=3104323 RepID=UPI002AFF2609|nr:glycosyltransferase family 4 protein [Nitrospirillum sp. BR 11163]MEA1672492.1 glycosyltransferase family 4 protein [Nitrospirillum sp. BR 11163]
MKILFLSNLYPPNVVGGYERLCADVAGAFVQREHEVAVLTSTYGGKVQDYAGQTVHRSLTLLANADDIYSPFSADEAERARINAANVAILHATVAAEKPDVIFAWNLFFFDLSLLRALEGVGCRVVLMLTDNWLIAALDGDYIGGFFTGHVFGDKPFMPPAQPAAVTGWRRLLPSWIRAPAAPVVTPRFPLAEDAIFGAAFMRDLYADAGISFRSHKVIHNGVRIADMPSSAFRDRRQFCDPGTVRLLFAGRLVDLKGVHTALEALAHLRRTEPDRQFHLTIVGDGQDRAYSERLKGLIADLDVAPAITFQEPVREDALFRLFNEHDIYLFPSLYEPFSLTLIHALACGIPTVASAVGGNVEIVTDRESGILFRKGDAQDMGAGIMALVGDPELRHRVSARARTFARGFTFERMVTEMERYLI